MKLAKLRRAPMELHRQRQAPVEEQSLPSITDLSDMKMPKNGELTIFALAFFFAPFWLRYSSWSAVQFNPKWIAYGWQ
jgi:hypothetical protein